MSLLLWRKPARRKETSLRLITQAELLLDEHRSAEALQILQTLRATGARQHATALRLELKAQQQLGNWEGVLNLLGQLDQRDGLDQILLKQFRRHAHVENLKSKMLDPQALREYWQSIPSTDKKDSKLAAIAAHACTAIGDCAAARQIIEQSLDAQWDSELAELYAECAEKECSQPDRTCGVMAEISSQRCMPVACSWQIMRSQRTVGESAKLPGCQPVGRARIYRSSRAGAIKREDRPARTGKRALRRGTAGLALKRLETLGQGHRHKVRASVPIMRRSNMVFGESASS